LSPVCGTGFPQDARLQAAPGFDSVTPVGINNNGWVAGYAGDPYGTGARAVVWKPMGANYEAIDLGVLPGHSSSWSAGIDDQNRAVGWSTTGGAIPSSTAPFKWSKATGLTVTDEAGGAVSGARVRARFLDDYYLDQPVGGDDWRYR
jgi:hypothetical protein